ncbi:MAG: HipA domain-containing protein [Kiritimatiellae bacterium]|nr:HipA domain-containing protein [Kiritimatiellia bacterium]
MLFDSRNVSRTLPYDPPQRDAGIAELFLENRKRASISGVQEKVGMVVDRGTLRLAREGEQSTHILKPVPRDLKNAAQVPANEYLTMQTARKVYGVATADNGLVFFKDGEPAYLTRRFDVKPGGGKWAQEDFASLAGKTHDMDGPDFKYRYSYEEVGRLVRAHVPAWRVEIERFFAVVVFNYLFSNGDAHLKNFSLLENGSGDFLFSPAYDLINTRLHVADTDFALDKGLFTDGFRSPYCKDKGHPGKTDFLEWGVRLGIPPARREKLLSPFLEPQARVETAIAASLLDPSEKRGYLLMYQTRLNRLNEQR